MAIDSPKPFCGETAPTLTYRPEIDGLRALAVLSVVLFHANLQCPGGFVGVDVFFVISGYLISSLILRDLHAGRFSLAEFWERRIRRILPALVVMVLVTICLGGLLFLPNDYERLGKSAVAQAMLVANLYFWRQDSNQGGYFGTTSEARPLLHTWSLAVEEQFYLFFPLLLVVLFRFGLFRERRLLSRLLLVGLLIGLCLAAVGMTLRPVATFYLLPTRAWELLCGAWIASLSIHDAPRRKFTRELATWLGISGILLPCWLYSKQTPFPGLAAIPPCAGTALLIWGNTRRNGADCLTTVGRLLALRPVVFLGLISYSLYLWHWPILVFGKYWWLEMETPWYLSMSLVIASVFIAVLSWRHVETPFRKKITMTTRPAAFQFAATCTLLTLLCGASVAVFQGFPARLPEIAVKNEIAIQDRNENREITIEEVHKGQLTLLGASRSTTPRILLWGDSHAMYAVSALNLLCHEMNISGCAATRSSTPPLLDTVFASQFGLNEKMPEFSAAVLAQIKQRGITHVILAARWRSYQEIDSQLLENPLPATIRTLHEAGCKVWVLQDVPDVDLEYPRFLARAAIFGSDTHQSRRLVTDHQRKNSVMYHLAKQSLPATFLDPAPLLLDTPDSDRYRAEIDGVSIYVDSNHLTKNAAVRLLLPLLREAMAADLAGMAQPVVRRHPPINTDKQAE